MQTIETGQIAHTLDMFENARTSAIPLLLGPTGCGKTTAITQWAGDRHMETLILSHLDPADALGIPYRDTVTIDGHSYTTMCTATPAWALRLYAHRDDAQPPILFLDEYLRCAPDTANTFLNFITERTINGLDLSFVRIIAATNLDTWTFDPDAANLDRFALVRIHNASAHKYIKQRHGVDITRDLNITLQASTAGLDATTLDVLNQPRPLSPRNAEIIAAAWAATHNRELAQLLHEGYTNTPLPLESSHPNDQIARIIDMFVTDENTITERSLNDLAVALKRTKPRIKNWTPYVNNIASRITLDRARLIELIEYI